MARAARAGGSGRRARAGPGANDPTVAANAIAAALSTQAVTIDAAIQTATAKLAQRMPASGNVTGMFDEIA